jgi:predicted lipoprotein with Yx(FWY)xxD motif
MKRLHLFIISIILVVAFAACGSSTYTSSGSSSGNTSATPTTAANTSTTGAILQTASATVNGKSVTLLTNPQSMTLYYFLPDTATTSACTGGCASTWPPYLSKDISGSSSTLPGKLTLQTNANGQQVTYNGHPLYTYGGDTSAGQTNGEGIGNKWFVATSDLATNNGSTPTTSSGYGSGRY